MPTRQMLDTSEKLLCACGCGVPIVEKMSNPDRLLFRKRVNGSWHFIVIPLPEGTNFDDLGKRGPGAPATA